MAQNLNTPMALAELSRIASELSTKRISLDTQIDYKSFVTWLDALLGTQFLQMPDISNDQKQLLKDYIVAKADAIVTKNFAASDVLRNKLASDGIVVRETKNAGVYWTRSV
jgi:cysteinyl-tRNA synthetase